MTTTTITSPVTGYAKFLLEHNGLMTRDEAIARVGAEAVERVCTKGVYVYDTKGLQYAAHEELYLGEGGDSDYSLTAIYFLDETLDGDEVENFDWINGPIVIGFKID